jgi:hypothetical protein
MDEAPPPQMVARIKELIGQHAVGTIEAHDVRTRQLHCIGDIDVGQNAKAFLFKGVDNLNHGFIE